jgi:hypothetical protein
MDIDDHGIPPNSGAARFRAQSGEGEAGSPPNAIRKQQAQIAGEASGLKVESQHDFF